MPEEPRHKYIECDQTFSRSDSYYRHRKEQHYDDSKANLDFVEDMLIIDFSFFHLQPEQRIYDYRRRSYLGWTPDRARTDSLLD